MASTSRNWSESRFSHPTSLQFGPDGRLYVSQQNGRISIFEIERSAPNRYEENHATNGLALDVETNTLYMAQGGHTNMGAPSNNLAFLPEFALSAAILSIDLDAIGEATYDLPTLDDEDRAGVVDAGDPFGGNDGKNQALLVSGGPVQVYSRGYRNAYDLVITDSGQMYTIDNGPNTGWGGLPTGEGAAGCTNEIVEGGNFLWDNLHHVTGPGYYGGHANPTRANAAITFNTSNPQSPVADQNPIECDYRAPGTADGALWTFQRSTNGIVEYRAGNFGGELRGDIPAASFDNKIWRIELDARRRLQHRGLQPGKRRLRGRAHPRRIRLRRRYFLHANRSLPRGRMPRQRRSLHRPSRMPHHLLRGGEYLSQSGRHRLHRRRRLLP